MSAQGAKPPIKITYATMSGDQLEELHSALDAAIPAVRAAFGQAHPMWINGHAVKTVDHFTNTRLSSGKYCVITRLTSAIVAASIFA